MLFAAAASLQQQLLTLLHVASPNGAVQYADQTLMYLISLIDFSLEYSESRRRKIDLFSEKAFSSNMF